MIELLSFIPPLRSFPSDWMCFIYPWGVAGGGGGRGRRREGTREQRRGGFCGTSCHDERGLSLFYSTRLSSFQLFEASHQTGLNSRRDTISLSSSSSTTTHHHLLSSRYLAHTSLHPSLPPYLSRLCPLSTCDHRHRSTLSPAHNAAQWPLTGGPRGEKLAQVQAEFEH